MRRTELRQEIREMRFLELYLGWNESRLTEEAAVILGVTSRKENCRLVTNYLILSIFQVIHRGLSASTGRTAERFFRRRDLRSERGPHRLSGRQRRPAQGEHPQSCQAGYRMPVSGSHGHAGRGEKRAAEFQASDSANIPVYLTGMASAATKNAPCGPGRPQRPSHGPGRHQRLEVTAPAGKSSLLRIMYVASPLAISAPLPL